MNADEYAADFRWSIESHDLLRPRSQQNIAGQIGVSDLGACKERTRRVIAEHPPTDAPETGAALIGGYVDGGIKLARAAHNPNLQLDVPVTVKLANDALVPGTADEVDPDEPSVTDYKTVDGLARVRHLGPSDKHRQQVNLYYAALHQAGELPADGTVRLVYLDRSGVDSDVYVWQARYDPDWLDRAGEWLDDVYYALVNSEEASKDWPAPRCARWCQFFTSCRGGALVPTQLAATEEMRTVIDAYGQAYEQRKEGEVLVDALKPELAGVNARGESFVIESTLVNAKTPYWKTVPRRIG